jgi:hypothetical protein
VRAQPCPAACTACARPRIQRDAPRTQRDAPRTQRDALRLPVCSIRRSDLAKDELVEVFRDGKLLIDHKFEDIRKRASIM